MRFSLPPFRFRNEYFLVLLPLFFVMHGYSQNFRFLRPGDILGLLLRYTMIILVCSTIFFFLFRSWRKASLFAFFIMAYYLFFGAMHDAANKWLGSSFLVKYSFIFPFSLVVFILGFILLKRAITSFDRFTNYINLALIALILIESGLLIRESASVKKTKQTLARPFVPCDSCAKPDIYLVVADEYAGNTQLKEAFQFDNTEFEDQLRSRGFHIVENSKSNYNSTPFSIASMLNMDFVYSIKDTAFDDNSLRDAYRIINENSLTRILSRLGYETTNHSVFHFDNSPVITTSSFSTSGKDLINGQTLSGRFNRDLRFNLITRLKWKAEIRAVAKRFVDKNQLLMQKTMAVASTTSSKPKFVYLHLMMPHFPYVMDRHGRLNDSLVITNQTRFDQHSYLEYLQYSNKKFLELFDHLLRQKNKPIIIFVGDHGFRHFTTAEKSDNKYHFMNLNAIYLPDKNYGGFYDGMSNINEFAVLLNTRFNQQYPLLKDSTIFLKNWW